MPRRFAASSQAEKAVFCLRRAGAAEVAPKQVAGSRFLNDKSGTGLSFAHAAIRKARVLLTDAAAVPFKSP
jgi:hypothetical protein